MATIPKFFSTPQEKKEYYPSKVWKRLLLFLIILLVLILVFFFSPLFKIKRIDVIPQDEKISLFFNTYLAKNLFLIDTSKTTLDLEGMYPEILNVQISKGIPSVLRVKITSRQPKIVWSSGAEKFYVDESGSVFGKTGGEVNNLPNVTDNKNLPVTILKPVAISSFVNFVTEVQEKLANTELQVDHFEVNETTFQVDAVGKNNIKIIFDTTRPLDPQISAAQKVYTEHKAEVTKYMDVRVAERFIISSELNTGKVRIISC